MKAQIDSLKYSQQSQTDIRRKMMSDRHVVESLGIECTAKQIFTVRPPLCLWRLYNHTLLLLSSLPLFLCLSRPRFPSGQWARWVVVYCYAVQLFSYVLSVDFPFLHACMDTNTTCVAPSVMQMLPKLRVQFYFLSFFKQTVNMSLLCVMSKEAEETDKIDKRGKRKSRA